MLYGVQSTRVDDFWSQVMIAAYDQTPASLGVFLTQLVADVKTREGPDLSALLAVGMRATMSALACTVPGTEVGLVDETRALVILLTQLWLGWPVPRAT